MRWGEYRNFGKVDRRNITRNPGIYYIRCVDNYGKPVLIPRLGGMDNEGIIYIGETGRNLRNRLRSFWKTAHNSKVNRHRAGWSSSYRRSDRHKGTTSKYQGR